MAAPSPAAASTATVRIDCTACGKPNRAGALFCRSCGQAFDSAAAQPVTPRLRQPDLRDAPAVPPAAAAPQEQPTARPRPFTTLLLLLIVLVAAVLWWQRGTATSPLEPVPAPAGQAVGGAPQPPTSAAASERQAEQTPSPQTAAAPAPAGPQETLDQTTAAKPASDGPAVAPALPIEAAAPAAPPAARVTRPQRQNAAPVAERSPESVCAESSGGVPPSLCIGVQCFKSEFRRHPTCMRLENEARERRQREIDQGLVGG